VRDHRFPGGWRSCRSGHNRASNVKGHLHISSRPILQVISRAIYRHTLMRFATSCRKISMNYETIAGTSLDDNYPIPPNPTKATRVCLFATSSLELRSSSWASRPTKCGFRAYGISNCPTSGIALDSIIEFFWSHWKRVSHLNTISLLWKTYGRLPNDIPQYWKELIVNNGYFV
jgi:hypothetical protein